MTIVAYHNPNANPPWIAAVLINGKPWVFCNGQTEDAAKEAAESFYNKEKAKVDAQYTGPREAAQPITSVQTSVGKVEGRGHHFAGKTWLIHKETRVKIRVPHEEVDSYLAKGYERGGPRSK